MERMNKGAYNSKHEHHTKKEAVMSSRGGSRPGAGRPRAGTERVIISLTPEEHESLKSWGGSKWVRTKIREELEIRARRGEETENDSKHVQEGGH